MLTINGFLSVDIKYTTTASFKITKESMVLCAKHLFNKYEKSRKTGVQVIPTSS